MVLVQDGDDVMTVIKTKAQWPAWQPLNIRAAPSAEFSVDRSRHLMSFLTMLGPSPDWNVGLSAEDLCTAECGWVQRLTKDLLPWDAGTDGGHSYEHSRDLYLLELVSMVRVQLIHVCKGFTHEAEDAEGSAGRRRAVPSHAGLRALYGTRLYRRG
ncbi:spondin-1b [Tachysurus ichikawai]